MNELHRLLTLTAAVGLAICAVPAHAATTDSDAVTIVHAGELLARPGTKPRRQQTIVIRGRLIEAVHDGFQGANGEYGDDARIVDLSDRFVMPGLMDAHVHLTTEPKPDGVAAALGSGDADLAIVAALNAERLLDAGFTTVMDMGTGTRRHEKAIYAVRDGIADGLVPGPQILAAGSPISAPGASRSTRYIDELQPVLGPQGVCSGAEQCREAVREQIARGANFINFYNTGSLLAARSPAQTFTADEMRAIVEEAHALGRIAVADGGNTPGDASGIDTAIRAGADIIDTVTYPGEPTFRLLNDANGYFAPHVYALVAAVGDSRESLSQGSMGWLPEPILLELLRLKQQTPAAITGYRSRATLILAADSGVFDHGLNAHELIEYVKLGIDAMDALAAATVNAAAAHRIADRTGTIAAGLEADIVAFAGSPLRDMAVVTAPTFVMTDGRVHAIKR